jgi:hypothetical protein
MVQIVLEGEPVSDHPEFPQSSPEMKYVIEQVSKIEDAQACGTGYYKSLSKVLTRLDKTDTILNQLQQTTLDLKRVTDADVIATCIGKKSDEIQNTINHGLIMISDNNVKSIDNQLTLIEVDAKKSVAAANGAVDLARRTQHDLNEQMTVAIQRLDKHIRDVDTRVFPPMWKLWLYWFLTLAVGVAIGKWVFP